MKYYYPIVLRNKKLSPASFKICSEIELRRLSRKEREEFFGLEKIDFTFSENPIIGFVGFNQFFASKEKGRFPYSNVFRSPDVTEIEDILASNYVLIIDDPGINNIVERINLCFKLLRPTSTGAYLGFKENETDVRFHHNQPIHGPYNYLYLRKNDLVTLKKLFKLATKEANDEKFRLCSELYSRSLQGGSLGLDIRFLLAVISLECVYLPKRESELSFRLNIRATKQLSKFGVGKPDCLYNKLKNIYKVRSELIHSGKTKRLNNKIFSELTHFVRISLNLYLQNKKLFSEDSLTRLLLEDGIVLVQN